MTLAAQITADVSTVFLNTNDFAQAITHYPAGNEALAESVTVNFDQDYLDEATGGDGDGMNLTNQRGIRTRQAAKIDVPIGTTITEEGNGKASVFLIAGVRWVVKRIIGSDAAMQTVEIVRVDQKSTRRTQNL